MYLGWAIVLGGLSIQTVAEAGLILTALAMAAARGWGEAMGRRDDGRWPLPRKLAATGAGLTLVVLAECVPFRTVYVTP